MVKNWLVLATAIGCSWAAFACGNGDKTPAAPVSKAEKAEAVAAPSTQIERDTFTATQRVNIPPKRVPPGKPQGSKAEKNEGQPAGQSVPVVQNPIEADAPAEPSPAPAAEVPKAAAPAPHPVKEPAEEPAQTQQTAPDPADAILGFWVNEKGDRKLEIYRKGAGYFGKIVSDASGKVRPGTDILLDLRHGGGIWKGRLYLPAKNDEAKATLRLKGGQLEIAASKGVFSEKKYWSRP